MRAKNGTLTGCWVYSYLLMSKAYHCYQPEFFFYHNPISRSNWPTFNQKQRVFPWVLKGAPRIFTIYLSSCVPPRLQARWMRTCLWPSPAPTRPRSWTCTPVRVGSPLALMLTWSSGTRTPSAPSLPRRTTRYVVQVRTRVSLSCHFYSRYNWWDCVFVLNCWVDERAKLFRSFCQLGGSFSWLFPMLLIWH